VRSEFDQMLLENAREHGVDAQDGVHVIEVLFERDRAVGVAIKQDGERVATGRLAIVCVRKAEGEPMRAIAIPPEIAQRFRAVTTDGDQA